MKPCYAAVDPASPRHAAWLQLLGSDVVAIESPEPVACETADGPGLFYKARVQDLDAAAVDRLVDHLAALWQGSRREVIEELYGDYGCPIPASSVGVGPTPDEARAAARSKGSAVETDREGVMHDASERSSHLPGPPGGEGGGP